MVIDMVAQWFRLWWLIGWEYGDSLADDVVAHWYVMWSLIPWGCDISLVGDVVSHRLGL